MEKLTKEKLEEVKQFAENLGFSVCLHDKGDFSYFDMRLEYADISVDYTTFVDYDTKGELVTIGKVEIYTYPDEDNYKMTIEQSRDFIKYMGYAVLIAENLKE